MLPSKIILSCATSTVQGYVCFAGGVVSTFRSQPGNEVGVVCQDSSVFRMKNSSFSVLNLTRKRFSSPEILHSRPHFPFRDSQSSGPWRSVFWVWNPVLTRFSVNAWQIIHNGVRDLGNCGCTIKRLSHLPRFNQVKSKCSR